MAERIRDNIAASWAARGFRLRAVDRSTRPGLGGLHPRHGRVGDGAGRRDGVRPATLWLYFPPNTAFSAFSIVLPLFNRSFVGIHGFIVDLPGSVFLHLIQSALHRDSHVRPEFLPFRSIRVGQLGRAFLSRTPKKS